jgi:hypothetical protein
VSPPPSPVVFEGFLLAVWGEMAPILFPCIITDVKFAASGVNIFNSVIMPTFVGQTFGSGTGTNFDAARYINFIGRSTGGRRVRVTWFGCSNFDTSFRINPLEDGAVDDTVLALNGATPPLACIDGLTPVWKPYANTGVNAYWQHASRS